jgi:hypothetical protein
MVLVFVSALPTGLEPLVESQPGVMMHGEAVPVDVDAENVALTSQNRAGDKSGDDLSTGRDLPLDRIGMFSGLALITGFLCATELKGRPRLLVPALTALTLFLTVALLYMFGIF